MFAGLALLLLLPAGCGWGVSFPGETILSQIEEICRRDHKLDVRAKIAGKTLGVMHVMESMLEEETGVISEEFRKTMGNLILVSTRAALSTDIPIEFVAVVIRDSKHLIEIRVTRYLTDIKRAQTEALSATESMSRTLWDQSRLRPDQIRNDFFRLQDMTLGEFLIKQIVQRVRFAREAEADEAEAAPVLPRELVEGRLRHTPQGTALEFSIVAFTESEPEINVLKVFREVSAVLNGYGYGEFDRITIKDLLNRKVLTVDRRTLEMFQKEKVTESEILDIGFKDDLSESKRLKNALEIFGMNLQ